MSISGNNSVAMSSILASGGVIKNEFHASAGQTGFNLSFVLQSSSAVFVNGSVIASSEYSGVGTRTIVFNDALFENDLVVVIK
jgi:hypothetical protein